MSKLTDLIATARNSSARRATLVAKDGKQTTTMLAVVFPDGGPYYAEGVAAVKARTDGSQPEYIIRAEWLVPGEDVDGMQDGWVVRGGDNRACKVKTYSELGQSSAEKICQVLGF